MLMKGIFKKPNKDKRFQFNDLFKKTVDKLTDTTNTRATVLRKIKIRWRLIITFLILSIGPLLVLGLASFNSARSLLTDMIKQYTEQVVTQFGSNVSIEMTKIADMSNSFCLSSILQDEYMNYSEMGMYEKFTLINTLHREVSILSAQSTSISGISLVSKSGEISINQGYAFGIPLEEINIMFTESDTIYRWYVDDIGRLAYAKRAVNISTGLKIGNVFLTLLPSSVNKMFNSLKLGESVEVLLLTEEGIIVYANRENLTPGSLYPHASLIEEVKLKHDNMATGFNLKLNEKLYCNFCQIDKTPFYIITLTPHKFLNSAATAIGNQIAIIAVAGILLAILLAFLISNSISNPLSKLVNLMRKAREGDLTEAVHDDSRDEIGEVISNYNDMINNIKGLIYKVKVSVEDVLNSSEEISTSSEQTYASSEQIAITLQEVAKGSSEQAQEVSQSVDYMNNLSDGINKVTTDLSNVSKLILSTEQTSVEALSSVELLNNKANLTKTASQKIVEEINSLNSDMKEIRKIVKLIVGIAEQTNLLSLNAAIEAARAGAAGKGFAVVAEEVKKLADQSKEASIMINNIINAINNKSEHAVSEANSASDIIQEQMTAVKQTDTAFTTISSSMKEITAHMNNMEASVNSMLNLKEKTLSSMENISAVSEEAAATSEEVSAGTEEQMARAEILTNLSKKMNDMAKELENAVTLFKIE